VIVHSDLSATFLPKSEKVALRLNYAPFDLLSGEVEPKGETRQEALVIGVR
jgi:hypothetical protein